MKTTKIKLLETLERIKQGSSIHINKSLKLEKLYSID